MKKDAGNEEDKWNDKLGELSIIWLLKKSFAILKDNNNIYINVPNLLLPMRTTKKLSLLILILFVCISYQSYAQIGLTSYSVHAIGINTSQNKPISGEIKAFANRDINDVIFELDGFYNFKPRAYHRFSVGIGLASSAREFYGIMIPASIEIYPLQDFKKLSLLFELAPELLRDYVNVRTLWGVRYSFGKLKSSEKL
mgnify:CR=1 FL=1